MCADFMASGQSLRSCVVATACLVTKEMISSKASLKSNVECTTTE